MCALLHTIFFSQALKSLLFSVTGLGRSHLMLSSPDLQRLVVGKLGGNFGSLPIDFRASGSSCRCVESISGLSMAISMTRARMSAKWRRLEANAGVGWPPGDRFFFSSETRRRAFFPAAFRHSAAQPCSRDVGARCPFMAVRNAWIVFVLLWLVLEGACAGSEEFPLARQ